MTIGLIALCAPAPQSGKSTVAQHLGVRHGFTKVAFATPLKSMTMSMLRSTGMDHNEAHDRVYGHRKEEIVPGIGKTSRYIQQRLGTEFGRNCIDEDVWVRITMAAVQVHLNAGVPVVIDDLRFVNELNAVRGAGGIAIRILRPDAVPIADKHPSEGALDQVRMAEVVNDGTITDLLTQIDKIIVL